MSTSAANNQDNLEFEDLVVDNDYEIARDHDEYIIRKKSNHHIVKECIDNSNGYKIVMLNRKKYYVHRVVALQWLPNDNPEINIVLDHCNHDRTDNRLENLRWCSQSENLRNKSGYKNIEYKYVNELSEEAFFVDEYNEHTFEDLWFDPETNCFYIYNGIAYRQLQYMKRSNENLFIYCYDINNKHASITLSKFKRYFNLI